MPCLVVMVDVLMMQMHQTIKERKKIKEGRSRDSVLHPMVSISIDQSLTNIQLLFSNRNSALSEQFLFR